MDKNGVYWATGFCPQYRVSYSGKATNRIVATLVSEKLFEFLQYDISSFKVNEKTWREDFSVHCPDFLIIESSLNIDGFSPLLGGEKESTEALEIVNYCQENGIKIAFWHTSNVHDVPLFLNIANCADIIYCYNTDSFSAYKKQCPGKRVSILLPAVQPKVHNPFVNRKKPTDRKKYILADCWASIQYDPSLLDKLVDVFAEFGCAKIVETKNYLSKTKLSEIGDLADKVEGCVHRFYHASMLKTTGLLIQLDSPLRTREEQWLQQIEAICCGALILTDLPPCPNFGQYTKQFVIELSDKNNIECIFSSGVYQDKMKQMHIVRRQIYNNHTYQHRISSILSDLFGDSTCSQVEKVSVVVITNRYDNIDNVASNILRQKYKNFEVVLVYNGEKIPQSVLEARFSGVENARLFQLSPHHNIGSCLNFAINQCTGVIWLKMDDDDFYGPNYVSDMYQTWKITNADIFGKPHAFYYFEQENSVVIRDAFSYSQSINSIAVISGATLAGKVRDKDRFRFSSELRASVDSEFVNRVKASGGKMVLSDHYNFVVYRSADVSKHTWRESQTKLLENSKFICKGESLEAHCYC